MKQAIALEQGSLWPAIEASVTRATTPGALRPIGTEALTLTDQGMEFLVRRATNGEANPTTGNGTAPDNPFLSAEPDLYLGDITDTHYCALNKSSVYAHHLLIVTRQFEPQETLLRMRDFVALSTCMREYDGIGFYDAGPDAGANQIHKHMHVVPLPLSPGCGQVPLTTVLSSVNGTASRIRSAPGLPYAHAFGGLSQSLFEDPLRAGEVTYDLYVDMMEMLGMRGTRTDGEFRQRVPYNLLLTRNWMLLVPRVKGHYKTLPIDALAFAGSIFVANATQLAVLRERGPMGALSDVARVRL